MDEWLVPVVLFLVTGAVFCTFFYFRYRARLELQATVRAALERGQELSPRVLEMLSEGVSGGDGDLRKGVLWLALTAALGVMAYVVEERELLGPAAFPLMFGIAYLGLWRFAPRRGVDRARAAE